VLIHTDCRRYRGAEPCRPHKERGARCATCGDYDQVEHRILIVKLGAMGDVLRTTSCLGPLRRRYPRGHVTWITRANAVPLLERNPLVDRLLVVDANYLEFLLAEEFDVAIGPDTDALSASIMRVARAREKYGFVADGRAGVMASNQAARAWWQLGLDDQLKRQNRVTYGQWLYAMCDLPMPVERPVLEPSSGARDRVAALLRDRAPERRRWVCFNTGASGRWTEKRWKPAHYRDLAALLTRDNADTGILLIGGPEEGAFNASLLASGGHFVDAGTTNSVDEFAAVVAASEWILTPDSLGYHVACAVETPATCLVGPTSPWELDVYGANQVLYSDRECIACYLPACPLSTTCMDALTASAVWDRVRTWSAGTGSTCAVSAVTA
jgi:lipopolysaccharide heptosyltransferase III